MQGIGTDGAGHSALAAVLKDKGVDVLICGGIGNGAVTALSEAGIDVYSEQMRSRCSS
ncbi:MAG: NifB/NifX family molybdenum-iron cluster-binding protein [Lachnospira eligens]